MDSFNEMDVDGGGEIRIGGFWVIRLDKDRFFMYGQETRKSFDSVEEIDSWFQSYLGDNPKNPDPDELERERRQSDMSAEWDREMGSIIGCIFIIGIMIAFTVLILWVIGEVRFG